MDAALPKKLASYIRDTGAHALDHLAAGVPAPAEGAAPNALQTLAANWRSMTAEQKEAFVQRIATSVGAVIAASALLPVGNKVGKKAVKSARKVLRKSARALKKNKKAAQKKKPAPAPKRKRSTKRARTTKKAS